MTPRMHMHRKGHGRHREKTAAHQPRTETPGETKPASSTLIGLPAPGLRQYLLFKPPGISLWQPEQTDTKTALMPLQDLGPSYHSANKYQSSMYMNTHTHTRGPSPAFMELTGSKDTGYHAEPFSIFLLWLKPSCSGWDCILPVIPGRDSSPKALGHLWIFCTVDPWGLDLYSTGVQYKPSIGAEPTKSSGSLKSLGHRQWCAPKGKSYSKSENSRIKRKTHSKNILFPSFLCKPFSLEIKLLCWKTNSTDYFQRSQWHISQAASDRAGRKAFQKAAQSGRFF